MQNNDAIRIIQEKFIETGNPVEIPLIRGNSTFLAECMPNGITVDNLGTQPFLTWEVFLEVVSLL